MKAIRVLVTMCSALSVFGASGCKGEAELGAFANGGTRGRGVVTYPASFGEIHVAPLLDADGRSEFHVVLMNGTERLDQVVVGSGSRLRGHAAWGDRVALQFAGRLRVFDAATGGLSVVEDFEPAALAGTTDGFVGLRSNTWIRLDRQGQELDARDTDLGSDSGAFLLRNLGGMFVLLTNVNSSCVSVRYLTEAGVVEATRDSICDGGFSFSAVHAGHAFEGRVPIVFAVDEGGAVVHYDVALVGGPDEPLLRARVSEEYEPRVELDEAGLHVIRSNGGSGELEYVRLDPATLEPDAIQSLDVFRVLTISRASSGLQVVYIRSDGEGEQTLVLRPVDG